MAKKKHASNLLFEDRLGQAMDHSVDAPCTLPENWHWVRLGDVCSLENGRKSDEKELVYLDAKTLRGIIEPQTRRKGVVVDKGQKVILVDGENSGEVFVVPYRGYMGSTFKIINISNSINEMYIRYFIDYNRDKLRNNKKGSAIPHLNKELFFSLELPVPPFPVQQRIVEHIESLFTKLDEAKEKAQGVVDEFESRKAAILSKAFSGELTKKWRSKQGLSDFWPTEKLSDVAYLQTGLMKGKKFDGATVFMPYLRVANVQDGYLDLNEIKMIEVSPTNYERYLLRKGDVLFTEGGDYDKLGRGTVWNNEIPNCLHQNHIFAVRVNGDCLLPAFLSYQASSQYGKQYFLSCAKQTTNLASINSTQLKNFPVMIPTLNEQQEIVRVLDNVFSKEKQAKYTAELVLDQINLLKKAILDCAFCGKLGTNNLVEESTGELLGKLL